MKINRSILKWGWYKNRNTARVFFHLLLCANFTDCEFEGRKIKRGQLLTGRKKLSADLGMSEQQIRTALSHLKSTNEITIETTPKYSIITVNSYDKYQSVTNNTTNNQPTSNQQPTNNQPQYKKEKKDKNIKKARINNARARDDERKSSYSIEDFESKSLFKD